MNDRINWFYFIYRYCLGNYTTIKDVNLTKTKAVAIVCADEEEEIIDDRILGYTMIISIIFLVMTIFVYSLLPELRLVQNLYVNLCGKKVESWPLFILQNFAVVNSVKHEFKYLCIVSNRIVSWNAIYPYFYEMFLMLTVINALVSCSRELTITKLSKIGRRC